MTTGIASNIEVHEFTDREEWLAFRKTKITSSELAIVMGMSSWGSPYSLWQEKVGLSDSGFEMKMHQKIGLYLETAILNLYRDESGRTIVNTPQMYTMYVNKEYPILASTPDSFQLSNEHGKKLGNLQVKNNNSFKRNEWDQDIPMIYQLQTQIECFTTGLEWGSICALFGGGSDFLWYDYEINMKFIEAIKPRVEQFQEYVKLEMPPPMDDTDHTLDALKALYPEDNGEEINLPADAVQWDTEYNSLSAQLKELNKEVKDRKTKRKLYENLLRDSIGSNVAGRIVGGAQYTLTTTHKKGYTVEPSSYRTLIRKAK